MTEFLIPFYSSKKKKKYEHLYVLDNFITFMTIKDWVLSTMVKIAVMVKGFCVHISSRILTEGFPGSHVI